MSKHPRLSNSGVLRGMPAVDHGIPRRKSNKNNNNANNDNNPIISDFVHGVSLFSHNNKQKMLSKVLSSKFNKMLHAVADPAIFGRGAAATPPSNGGLMGQQ